jgi:mono/diheme cytochrome c family protein
MEREMSNGERYRGAAVTGALAARLCGAAFGAACNEPASNTAKTNANVAATNAAAHTPPPATPTPSAPMTAVAAGKETYDVNCASCHGEDGKGKEALKNQDIPNFTDAAWQKRESDAELLEAIENGKGKMMPAWKGKLTETEMKDSLAYVRTFAGSGTAGSESKEMPATNSATKK